MVIKIHAAVRLAVSVATLGACVVPGSPNESANLPSEVVVALPEHLPEINMIEAVNQSYPFADLLSTKGPERHVRNTQYEQLVSDFMSRQGFIYTPVIDDVDASE